MDQEAFNEYFRQRTKKFAVDTIRYCKKLNRDYIDRVVVNQLVKSATSVDANYRAACRARSRAEFFAKISIVVEEADEAKFWYEVIDEAEMDQSAQLATLKQEAHELVLVVSKARRSASR
jgi:four helix bundle protein